MVGEQEIPEVVDREHLFEARLGLAPAQVEDARVVEQHVERPVAGEELVGELADVGLRCEVAELELHSVVAALPLDLLHRRLALGGIPAHQDHMRAQPGQLER